MKYVLVVLGVLSAFFVISRVNELHEKLDRVNDLVIGRLTIEARDSIPPTPEKKCELPPEQATTEVQPKVNEEDLSSKTEAAPASHVEAVEVPTPTPALVATPEQPKPIVKPKQPTKVYHK